MHIQILYNKNLFLVCYTLPFLFSKNAIIADAVGMVSTIPKVPPIANKIIPNIFIFIHLSFCNMLLKGLQPDDCRRSYIEGICGFATPSFSVWKWTLCPSFSTSAKEKYFVYIISYLLRIFYFHFSYRNFHTERNLFLRKEVCIVRNCECISPSIRPADEYM